MLRHCAGSRRSADAADSLAAVVSPPYRQFHSNCFADRVPPHILSVRLRACLLV